jgi:MoxR-like ATPase
LRAAKAWALLEDRDHVIPDDIQAVLPPVVGHRLRFRPESEQEAYASTAEYLARSVPVPA